MADDALEQIAAYPADAPLVQPISFDLTARKAVEIPPEVREALRAQIVPGLSV